MQVGAYSYWFQSELCYRLVESGLSGLYGDVLLQFYFPTMPGPVMWNRSGVTYTRRMGVLGATFHFRACQANSKWAIEYIY